MEFSISNFIIDVFRKGFIIGVSFSILPAFTGYCIGSLLSIFKKITK